jgi:STAM-binding protein
MDRQLRGKYGRDEEPKQRQDGDSGRRPSGATQPSGRGAEALAAARAAAGVPQGDYSTPRYDDGRNAANRVPADLQRQEDARRQQEEMKQREEEITRRRIEERRRQEQSGIARRQEEANAAANAARGIHHNPNQNLSLAPGSYRSTTVMPLESPRYEDDSTDAESVAHGSSLRVRRTDRPKGTDSTPSRTPQRKYVFSTWIPFRILDSCMRVRRLS